MAALSATGSDTLEIIEKESRYAQTRVKSNIDLLPKTTAMNALRAAATKLLALGDGKTGIFKIRQKELDADDYGQLILEEARKLLARHKGGTRQIVVITDGEPTAYWEPGHSTPVFSYPPTPRTLQQTLLEVARCTREGLRINTFMLERSYGLMRFVDDITRINRGRAFFADPERLGDYILVDYLQQKSKRIAS